nr:Retrovirus-related Pol polyprotein from transposon TNT 1-94 [Ipomoea batatas]
MSFTGGVAAVCEICQLGKQTRLPFPVEKTWRATEKIQLIHTGGGMKNVSINDSKYFILFIDDFTRMCWVYFLKQKSEVADVFWKFKSWIEHQFTVIYTLQQNGVSERKNRTVIDMTQCLLFEKGMPKKFYYWIWSTSLCQNEKFNKDDGSEKVDETAYRSIIGCLIFLTSTRPVIMFSMAQEEATTIFVDNQAAIAVSRNSVFHGKTKHFKVKLYFVREVQKTNEVNLVRCSTGVQLADILTKGLPRSRFELSLAGDRLIIASDGVWDSLSAEAAFECARGMQLDAAATQIDKTLVILMLATTASLAQGIKTEGLKEGWYDGGNIALAVIIVIILTGNEMEDTSLNQNKDNATSRFAEDSRNGGNTIPCKDPPYCSIRLKKKSSSPPSTSKQKYKK